MYRIISFFFLYKEQYFTPAEPYMMEYAGRPISQIDDTIMELPDKYETMLGERGVNYQEDRSSEYLLQGTG